MVENELIDLQFDSCSFHVTEWCFQTTYNSLKDINDATIKWRCIMLAFCKSITCIGVAHMRPRKIQCTERKCNKLKPQTRTNKKRTILSKHPQELKAGKVSSMKSQEIGICYLGKQNITWASGITEETKKNSKFALHSATSLSSCTYGPDVQTTCLKMLFWWENQITVNLLFPEV